MEDDYFYIYQAHLYKRTPTFSIPAMRIYPSFVATSSRSTSSFASPLHNHPSPHFCPLPRIHISSLRFPRLFYPNPRSDIPPWAGLNQNTPTTITATAIYPPASSSAVGPIPATMMATTTRSLTSHPEPV